MFLVKIGRILWHIEFIDLWNEFFFERNSLDILLYVFFTPPPPIILLSINILFIIYVFIIERINDYTSPFIRIVFILEKITVSLGMLSSWYILSIGFVYPYDVMDQYDTFCAYIQHEVYTACMILCVA